MAEPAGSPVRPRAAVVVLGDVGRSPRMQYHALSLAEQVGLSLGVPLSLAFQLTRNLPACLGGDLEPEPTR